MTAALTQELIAWRSRLIGDLERAITGGDLALLANVQMALWAIEPSGQAAASDEAIPAGRAVVADDGRVITITLYTGRERAGVVVLEPAAAAAIAGKLVDAVSRRI